MSANGKRIRVTFNAPVILAFALLCVAVQVLNILTHGESNRAVFSVYRAPLTDPMTWLRCVTHVLGHADWSHLLNNMMLLLILGPMLEEKYGSLNVLFVILATAIATGIVIMAFFPRVMLMGASGVVFAMVLLSSITSAGEGEIPLTFIVVAVLYLGQQVYEGIFVNDNISQIGHIVGGMVGSALGFVMNRNGMGRTAR